MNNMRPDRVLCKDGGFATQLKHYVDDNIDQDPLWSARYNLTNPEAVIQTHMDYLNAGADIISTNTYQASLEGYKNYLQLTEQQSSELIKETVRLAHIAKDQYLEKKLTNNIQNGFKEDLPLIMASIGPYGASLHDGSEYTGSYADVVPIGEIINWHRSRINAVLEGGVDGLAIETIPCQIEAEALVELICKEHPDVKFWISLQCKNETNLAHNEIFRDVALSIWQIIKSNNATDKCLAIGINCIHPKYVTPLLKSINNENQMDEDKIPLIAYANSGELYDVNQGWYGIENCIPLDHYAPEWIKLGAKIIGGCCRIYPRDIERIKETIERLCRK